MASLRHKAGALRSGDVLLFVCSFDRSSVRRQRVLLGQWPDWPSSAIMLAAGALLGQSGHVRHILIAAGAYRVGPH